MISTHNKVTMIHSKCRINNTVLFNNLYQDLQVNIFNNVFLVIMFSQVYKIIILNQVHLVKKDLQMTILKLQILKEKIMTDY